MKNSKKELHHYPTFSLQEDPFSVYTGYHNAEK